MDPNRRIYSPYREDDATSQVYRDSIDRIGDFFVSTADTILWGKLDDEELDQEENQKSTAKTAQKKKKKNGGSSAGRRGDTSWRDRLEERFDSMLGIHEDGEYYNRWAEQEAMEDEEAEGNDAFSVAQGRPPKRRRRSRRSKVYDKPFWEQDNLISALFGRSPPDGYSRIGPGNLLPFFKSTGRALLVLATNACEWASVRGSIPQPVVVVGVTSCFLSARSGNRLLALAISLVAFRIFGELIHEGLYGDEDWEEGDDDEEDEVGDMPHPVGET